MQTKHTIISDNEGNPQYVVVPYQEYIDSVQPNVNEDSIPNSIIRQQVTNNDVLMEAWCKHKRVLYAEQQKKQYIEQPEYVKKIQNNYSRRNTIEHVAAAMGIDIEQMTE